MNKQKTEIEFKNIFVLLAGDSPDAEREARNPSSSFSDAFNRIWKEADGDLRKKMIRLAGGLDVENGLQIVFFGLRDTRLEVREEAKRSLERLARQIVLSAQNSRNAPSAVPIRRVEEFLFAVYREMKITTDYELIRFYLHTLLETGERGAFLAWQFFAQRIIPENIACDIVRRIPVPQRLLFVYQYTLDRISVRKRYSSSARLLLEDIREPRCVVAFLADLFDRKAFLDSVFYDLCQKLRIQKRVADIELRSDRQEEKIKGLKVLGLLGDLSEYHLCLPLLSANEASSVRVACLEVLGRSSVRKDSAIISAVSSLADDRNEEVRFQAFKTLAALKVPGTGKRAYDLCKDFPAMKERLYQSFRHLEWMELNGVLTALGPDQSKKARQAIVHTIVQDNPEKLTLFLNQYLKSPDDRVREEARKLVELVDSIKKAENKEAAQDDTRKYTSLINETKGILAKRRRRRLLERLVNREALEGEELRGEVFSDLDLSGVNIRNTSFDGAFFSNVNISSAQFHSVSFKGAHFENVNMDNASFDLVSFENAVLKKAHCTQAVFSSCSFADAWIYESCFSLADLKGSVFIDARIKKSDFLRSDLTEASFVGSHLARVSFSRARLYLSDFSLARGEFCDFSGVDFSGVATRGAFLNARSALFADILIPSLFFEDKHLACGGFSVVVLSHEMDRRRKGFLEYNLRRTELALDTFSPEQVDLFELIPFLIHSSRELLPAENPVRNAPSGIFGYSFSEEIMRLADKYFNIDESPISAQKKHDIQGLFTIGSVGTVAQSSDSDIDYWVCVNDEELGEAGTGLLKAKLRAIEEWAERIFNTDIHFFLIDLPRVREDRFGASDQESSGSAQGKILKEEFYRTMFLVAGKIPFWCVFPTGIRHKHYQSLCSLAFRFHKDYLDLGDVSTIPKGEYFGASIWQLFKGMKSPYKSVIKMALLEKYIQDEDQSGLLCNKLKEGWLSASKGLQRLDPYLLLFEEVLEYYQKTGQKSIERLLQLCFFLKLGIRSISESDSVIGAKKRLVQDYIRNRGWTEAMVNDLGRFREWPFDRIFRLSAGINKYMIETYRKLGSSLHEISEGETIITPQDLTTIGRKMFVQFSKQPDKVEKLQLVLHGSVLFDQLYLKHVKGNEDIPVWRLYQIKTYRQEGRKREDLLKRGRIQEIAIWLVHNGFYAPGGSFHLMPNPTPVSLQDILDLMEELHRFFPMNEAEEIAAEALSKEPRIQKLFMTVNFSMDRKLVKIHEYATIYMTTWGEYFCRIFYDEKGLNSITDALTNARKQLNIPSSFDRPACFVPQAARKHIAE